MEDFPVFSKLSYWSVLPERLGCVHLVWQVSSVTQIMGTESLLYLKVRKIFTVLGHKQSSGERDTKKCCMLGFSWGVRQYSELLSTCMWQACSGKA